MALSRETTVTVHTPEGQEPLKRRAVIDACSSVVKKENLRCVQEVGMYFRVTVASIEAKEKLLSVRISTKNGSHVPVLPVDDSKLVRVSRLPFEVPEKDLRASLEGYGSIVSYKLELDKDDGLPTGTRLLRVKLSKAIPNRLFVSGFPCTVWYPGQPKLCHHCSSRDHLLAQCPERGLCRACRQPGHMAKNCPQKKAGKASDFSWGSKPPVESPPEVAGVVETAASSPGRKIESPIEDAGQEIDSESIEAEPDPPAPIHVEVVEEGDSPALAPPPSSSLTETASSNGSVPAKHSSPVIGAAADLVALEFSRTRNTTSSFKAKSKVKPKR